MAQENSQGFCDILDSDGSYLLNIVLKEFFSYQDLEKFSKRLAEQRGVAIIPYQTGFLRFSIGDYLDGSEQSYEIFAKELENSLRVVLKYWRLFYDAKSNPAHKDKRSEDFLDEIFRAGSDLEWLDGVLQDFSTVANLAKVTKNSLTISDIMTLYHAFPKDSGVTISTLRGSRNSVLEFYENIGRCSNLKNFVESRAFTKIYENLLPQIFRNIPSIKGLDINTVVARYGKATLLKYIQNKIEFQPNSHVLDNPNEKNTMKEILMEMERILFADAKVKILALNASHDLAGDKATLEGYNRILRKYLEELLLHFNLPFAQIGIEPTVKEVIEATVVQFKSVVGKSAGNSTCRVISRT